MRDYDKITGQKGDHVLVKKTTDPTTIRIDKSTREKARDLQAHYGHTLSGLIRFLIKRAWEELRK